jgi:uncharacterized protein (DUF488 family)
VVRTIGHGTLPADAFVQLVRAAAIEVVLDVRRFPVSRRHPHFASDAMRSWLGEHDIAYRWLSSLGGRRKPTPGSPNVALRNAQFRAYADHMTSAEFEAGVADLCRIATQSSTVVMCSESVWWRCHRRLLADHLVLVEGVHVEHLFHDGRLTAHAPMREARRADGDLVYDLVSPSAV